MKDAEIIQQCRFLSLRSFLDWFPDLPLQYMRKCDLVS